MECTKANNATACPCPKAECPRRGACCECLKHHLAKQQLPACCFAALAEPLAKDRSFAAFARLVTV
jgi:hypothetical protein